MATKRKMLLIAFVNLFFLFSIGQSKDSITKTVKLKAYKEVITTNAITSRGFFTIHKIEDRYFFEIPDTLLGRDILIVDRISKGAAGSNRGSDGNFGYGGDLIQRSVIRFEKAPNNKLLIKQMNFYLSANDTSSNGMVRSVEGSSEQAIAFAFDIKAISVEHLSSVVDVTDFLNGDNTLLSFLPNQKSLLNLGAFQADKSYIKKIKAFPNNIEIYTVKTYPLGQLGVFNTYELSTSIVGLPAQPMKSRKSDFRVGYFSYFLQDFDADGQRIRNPDLNMLKWNIEPKPEDVQKYARGELVEPKKPIVFYIDPATPKKWVPYLIKGVNAWQKTFEKAGFKNAIYATEAPGKDEDSTWSLEDSRYSAIVYKPSHLTNANGPPDVFDPRSGEILESHINWYHNLMKLLHDWYFVQASAVDINARKMEFDDSLMGKLITYVASHEVGHVLGLQHNYYASSTIPVDSLRNKKWVEENGTCPSIMDYARFNYVAQPEDSLSENELIPGIGIYDEWAIEWGYRLFPNIKSEKEEREYRNEWVIEKTKHPRLRFVAPNGVDPRCQTEDLGDDQIKANTLGILNLKRVLENLVEWGKDDGVMKFDFQTSVKSLYDEVWNQYTRYIGHIRTFIGGVESNFLSWDQPGNTLHYVEKGKQKKAVSFLQDQLFTTPLWLADSKWTLLMSGTGPYRILDIQESTIHYLLSDQVFSGLIKAEAAQPLQSYPINEYLDDLKKGIFKELKSHTNIDLYRRNLQKAYLTQLCELLNKPNFQAGFPVPALNVNTDVISTVKAHLKKLLFEIKIAIPFYKNDIIRHHLVDSKERIEKALCFRLDAVANN